MAADTVKSNSITNLDASPVVPNTRGLGAPGDYVNFSDIAAATTGGLVSTSSTYKVIRLPSNCKIKAMKAIATSQLDSNGSATLALDIGAYYSDSTNDGTQQSLAGTLISANCFMANTVFGGPAAGTSIDCLTAFSVAKRMQELWQALGLSSDPEGFIDVVIAVHTVAATAVAGNIMISADVVL